MMMAVKFLNANQMSERKKAARAIKTVGFPVTRKPRCFSVRKWMEERQEGSNRNCNKM
jgi:hypothetical protein